MSEERRKKRTPLRLCNGVLQPKGFGIRSWDRTIDADTVRVHCQQCLDKAGNAAIARLLTGPGSRSKRRAAFYFRWSNFHAGNLLLQDPPLSVPAWRNPVPRSRFLVRHGPRASASSRPIRRKKRCVGANSITAMTNHPPARRPSQQRRNRGNKGFYGRRIAPRFNPGVPSVAIPDGVFRKKPRHVAWPIAPLWEAQPSRP